MVVHCGIANLNGLQVGSLDEKSHPSVFFHRHFWLELRLGLELGTRFGYCNGLLMEKYQLQWLCTMALHTSVDSKFGHLMRRYQHQWLSTMASQTSVASKLGYLDTWVHSWWKNTNFLGFSPWHCKLQWGPNWVIWWDAKLPTSVAVPRDSTQT